MTTMTTDATLHEVRLYESNAGHLSIWCPEREIGYDITECEDAGFVALAVALAAGGDDEWTGYPVLSEEPDYELIAWIEGERLSVSEAPRPGVAGCRMLARDGAEVAP